MTVEKRLLRIYDIQDVFMRDEANTMLDGAFIDQPQLVAFDTSITTTYLNGFRTIINEAAAFLSDDVLQAQLRQKTDVVENTKHQCCDYYQASKHFILAAFSGNRAIMDEFGYSIYKKVKNNQQKMVVFMDELYNAGNKYRVQLKAVGASDAQINAALTLRDKLKSDDAAQEDFKKYVKIQTRERIVKHNQVWANMKKISEVGKIVFQSNYAKYQQYLLPASHESEKSFLIKGKIIDTVTFEPIEGVMLSIESLTIDTSSDSNGNYGFGLIPAGTYSIRVVKTGYTTKTIDNVVVTPENVTLLNILMVKS